MGHTQGPKDAGTSDSVYWPLMARQIPMAQQSADPWSRSHRIGVSSRRPGRKAETQQYRPRWRTMGSPRWASRA
ncbi:MAG: hypothetical protein ACRDP7_12890 [Trebonia sp.]